MSSAADPAAGDSAPAPETQRFAQLKYERPPGSTDLFIVRHGESQAIELPNLPPMLDGQADPPLSELGREQAELLGERLAEEAIDAIYITPLQRTAETAAPLARRLGLEPTVEPGLRELHLGEWEGGLHRKFLAEGDPIAKAIVDEYRWDLIPGSEPAEEFRARVRTALVEIAERHADERVAIVAHQGTNAEIVAASAGTEARIFRGSDNASVSHLIFDEGAWTLRRYNDSAHLGLRFTERPAPPT